VVRWRAYPAPTVTCPAVDLTFEQAAAVPVAGVTTLQALRDKVQAQPGQRVLANGAAVRWGRLRCSSSWRSAPR
jgi:NADPH:quinone reductase-like Zn-dependent oxidoreductase